jgi:hypothetical protein
LVRRGARPDLLNIPEFDRTMLDLEGEPVGGSAEFAAGDDDIVVDLTVGGDVSLFSIDSIGNQCVGFVSSPPEYVITISEDLPFGRVFFNGSADSTLLVMNDQGDTFCNDDAGEVNLNPMIEANNLPAGTYYIYVGSFDPLLLVDGTLVLTTDAAVMPGLLEDTAIPVSAGS